MKWKTIYRGNIVNCNMIVGLLQENLIRCRIENEHMGGFAIGYMNVVLPEVSICTEDVDRAREILSDHEHLKKDYY